MLFGVNHRELICLLFSVYDVLFVVYHFVFEMQRYALFYYFGLLAANKILPTNSNKTENRTLHSGQDCEDGGDDNGNERHYDDHKIDYTCTQSLCAGLEP